MASIRTRGAAHQVLWREDGKQTSQTFEDIDLAKTFRALLEAEGSQQAYAWLTQRGVIQGEAGSTLTLDEWVLEHYIPGLTGITDGTRSDYRRIYELRWSESLGKLPMEDASLKRARVAAAINDMAGTRSAKTIANGHGLLSAALQAAAQDPDIPLSSNPCRGIRLPSGESNEEDAHEMCCLTRDQFALLYSLVRPFWQPLVLLLYATGLRWGEATALQPRDLDRASGMLRVRRAFKRGAGGSPVLGAPKHNSRRAVSIGPDVADVLAELCKGVAPGEFVFRNGPEGTAAIRSANFHTHVWRPALYSMWRCVDHWTSPNPCGCRRQKRPKYCEAHKTAPVPCGCSGTLDLAPRVHDLRHTHASQLIAARIPLLAVSRRLGHKSISITVDVYGHLMQESQDEIAAAVTRSLEGVA